MPDEKQAMPTQAVGSIRSESFVRVYTNSCQLDVNPWDFTLVFGELKKTGTEHSIEERFAVVMSPQHAKAVANILNLNIAAYEKQIGEIKMPPTEVPNEPKAQNKP